MLLCIDCGNTNTVFSLWDGARFTAPWRTATDHRQTADQYFVWLSTLKNLQKIDADITDVIISSTVPRVVFNLRVLCDRYFHCRPLVVGKPDCLLPTAPRVDQVPHADLVRSLVIGDRCGHDLVPGDLFARHRQRAGPQATHVQQVAEHPIEVLSLLVDRLQKLGGLCGVPVDIGGEQARHRRAD